MEVTLNWGPVASGKYKKAKRLFKVGEYVKAGRVLTKDLAKKPNKYGFYALGQCLIAMGDYTTAERVLHSAQEMDGEFHEVFSLLGDVYVHLKQGAAAVEVYGQAVAIDPKNEQYSQKLANVLSAMKFEKVNPNLKSVLAECMDGNHIEMMHMGAAWLSIVKHDTEVSPFYALSKHKEYNSFKKEMEQFAQCDGLVDPFFVTGFGRFIVTNITFENWLKFLRRYFLESLVEGKKLFSNESDVETFVCVLSRYCFLTDYIISYGVEEKSVLETLEKKIIKAGANPNLSELACYGCYKPLYALPDSKEIAAHLSGGDHISQILKSQIEDYWEQQRIIGEIETLSKVENEVSKAVQAQYETFPYPRWNVASKQLYDSSVEGYLKDTKANILVAGCGTGKEAIQMAYVFPDAKITAVDLSKTSLAYAIFKAHQLGVKNISFYQADIMDLANFEDWQGRFDYVASAGVLHHMVDPKAGWKVLCGLLKDKGLMRIGLYSRYARWAVNEAREVIEAKKIGSSAQSIREFRDNSGAYLEDKAVKRLEFLLDYYNLSEYRDFLFHVQEHQFDLAQIKEHLDELGLEFQKFYLRKSIVEKYKAQNAVNDVEGNNLESWNKWEQENPDIFIAMYNFWCRKTS